MNQVLFQIRECSDPTCRLRFPMAAGDRLGERCPRCRGRTQVVHLLASATPADQRPVAGTPIEVEVLLDNVRSLFNVGSIFRSADGAGLAHLYLCGITPTPENRKLAKTALGAEQNVPWSYHPNGIDLADSLLGTGREMWALEATDDAVSLLSLPARPARLLLVAGNERTGVDPDLLARCTRTVALPMRGAKHSLNVATALGVAAIILAALPVRSPQQTRNT